MKKLLFIFSIAVLAFSQATVAQTTMKSATGYSADTVQTGSLTKTLVSDRINGYQKVAQVTITGTKISGTVAGTASLEGSLDGTNWFALSATTYTFTDVTSQTFSWNVTELGAVYMRTKLVGTGTLSVRIESKYVVRKP